MVLTSITSVPGKGGVPGVYDWSIGRFGQLQRQPFSVATTDRYGWWIVLVIFIGVLLIEAPYKKKETKFEIELVFFWNIWKM